MTLHDELKDLKSNAEKFISINQIFWILRRKHENISISNLAILLKRNLSNTNISLKYLSADLNISIAQRYDSPILIVSNILNSEPPLFESLLDNIIETDDLNIFYELKGKTFDTNKYGFFKDDLMKILKSTNLDISDELLENDKDVQDERNNEEVYIREKQQTDYDLQKKLKQARNEIETLKQNTKPESQKTINAQARFIKALLYIMYGEDVAKNPRPSIDGAVDEIRRDFEKKKLSSNLPSGVTVERWVDSVDLKIDS